MKSALALLLAACSASPPVPPAPVSPPQPDAAGAKAFAVKVNEELQRRGIKASTAAGIKNNFITADAERMSAVADEGNLADLTDAVRAAARGKDGRMVAR